MQQVPFFKPDIGEEEIQEVVECLRSGWLTTGNRTKQFEEEFRNFVGSQFSVAVNSCTAALHLAVAALEVQPGDGVLVPTWTFAATAEIIQYLGGIPILVDCDPVTMHLDLSDARNKMEAARSGLFLFGRVDRIVGIIPVHVGGEMCDMDAVTEFAKEFGLWVVEDAAHTLPASYLSKENGREICCGETQSAATCYSFYANKTITTGEGGMLVTNQEKIAERVRQLSLHGLSSGAWNRFSDSSKWDYRIIEAGFKYNLTDIASSIGIHQLRKAHELRNQREKVAKLYYELFASEHRIELPRMPTHGLHSWHLFPIRLHLERIQLVRNAFCERLGMNKIGFSVHWRPLHLHPLYSEKWGWRESDCPHATQLWPRVVSLPIFAGMSEEMVGHVAKTVVTILNS